MYGKSASAGGASMTPSSVACVCAVIEVMRVRPPAAAQLIATHETGALAGLTAVEHAVLEVAVALLRAYPASAMSKERTVLLRTTSFSVEAGEAAVVARAATVASDEDQQPPSAGSGCSLEAMGAGPADLRPPLLPGGGNSG